MPKLLPHIKEGIEALSKKDLEKLVIKAATANPQFRDFLHLNFLDKEYGEQDLFDQAVKDIDILMSKSYKGFSDELRLANKLSACNKRITQFGKICKTKSLELDLVMKVLELPFSLPPKKFTTCFTSYNFRVYHLLKKAISILENKLYEDYIIEYAPTINEYLIIFHEKSSHLDYVYNLKKEI